MPHFIRFSILLSIVSLALFSCDSNNRITTPTNEDEVIVDVDVSLFLSSGLTVTTYKDNKWKMYDANGNVFITSTREECAAAARPDVDVKYQNYCVECLPAYVKDITQTYLIPVTPVRKSTSLLGGRGRATRGARGVAFNGTRFDGPAPTNAILSAYTLAPFDDAGGHINLHTGYHYHAATGATTEIDQEDGHAPMIGYAMDGYGLFAQLDATGKESTDLDNCRGHYDELRGYHYHADAAGNNNFINCLSGAIADTSDKRMGFLPFVFGGLASIAFGFLFVVRKRK